ncbi:MAG: hypothetical protein B7Y90_11390 [Alphaproteobacteria bacterium 32-64-14]|nr:MAG: hypothetical protein B7Y90_11390 [Alphaproteobacteria bacterium 32-64-14]
MAVALGACAAPPAAEPAAPPPMITGGYAKADPADARTQEAQALAVAEIYKRNPTRALVEKADFDITMTGGARYKIVVYRTLQNALSVTSYEKLN